MNSNSAYLNLAAYASPSQPTSVTTPSFSVSSAPPNPQQIVGRVTQSRNPSAQAQLASEQGSSAPGLEDVTRHEDPNAPDQANQYDGDYVEGRQSGRRVPMGRRNGNPRQATSRQPASVPNCNARKASGPSGLVTTCPPAAASAPPPIPALAPAGNGIPPEPIIDPALLNHPPPHPQPHSAIHHPATPLGSNIPPTSQVPSLPTSVWSESSSPHGNITPSNFQVSPPSPAMWPPTQNTVVVQAQYSSPFGVPSPLPQAIFVDQSVGGAAAQTQVHQAPLSGSPESDSESESDVLGTLRNKTRKRRGRPIQLPLAVGAEQGAGLLTIEADPQNISSWLAPQRPLLLLARFEYGALLNTENGAPSPGALVCFQAEAYSRAIASISQSKRHGLPEKPTPIILRCLQIHKHCSAFRGRIKDAALDAVHDLLHHVNFIFREIKEEGRAGPWRHPAITSVIINSTFGNQEAEGVLTKQRYLPLVPAPVIFLACTAIQHALEMWSSGVKVQQPFKFDATQRSNYQVYKRNWDEYLEQWGEEGEEYMKETRELLANRIRNVIDTGSEQGDDNSGGLPSSNDISFFSDTDAI
ncbi:hypothetical protein FRC04_008938 [Tulasnella sp. 424]|nr:hypothetical protein FRC04_008938 [Tulasnella sp. 424]KAG8964565.1 hypothetical protein FRC05_003774 [Tulasnella sp. 425]